LSPEAGRLRAWCYVRNLIHTTFREARHVGPVGDGEAKLCLPSDHRLIVGAKRCSEKRALLKGTFLFSQTASAKSVYDIVRPYRDATGLKLTDLVSLFSERGWAGSYGGEKWATIARAAVDLTKALNNDDLEVALKICDSIKDTKHNSGPLVPSLADWHSTPYLQEKWPEMCD